jgi:glycosyltransferase involved in cell wall biosynthesis
MKVALLAPITWRTPPRRYGPWEKTVALLAKGLVTRGVEVTVFATGDSLPAGHLEAVCPVPLGEHPGMSSAPWMALHFAHFFEQADTFDIIHNNYDFWPLTYTPYTKTPMITTDHGFAHTDNVAVFQKYNDTNHYVAISQAAKHPLIHYSKTIHHGLDLEEYTIGKGSKGYLLFFGRIDYEKGVHNAIKVARKTQNKLVIAGLMNDPEYFKKYVKPELDEQITYVGNVGPDKHNELLGNALALLHLIDFDEPFGLSVIESMSCGTPVIAYSRGSMPELIVEGQTGFLVDTVDAASKAVGRLDSINRTDCRTHVAINFSVERMAGQYIELYERV